MRLKYYLKGLGIGLIIASLLMGLATKGPTTITDEEIKSRAKELGMVEQKTLADRRQEVASQTTERPAEITPPVTSSPPVESKPIETIRPVEQEPVRTEEPPLETEKPAETLPVTTKEPTEESKTTESLVAEQEIITFEIQKGESSDSISKRLEEQGLVENAVAYNNYLCNNGQHPVNVKGCRVLC